MATTKTKQESGKTVTNVSHAKPKAKPTKKEAAIAAVAKMRQAALAVAPPPATPEIVLIPLDLIWCNAQVRTEFNDESLTELAQDIATNGLIQPVVVRRNDSPNRIGVLGETPYVMVAGERRYRAAKLAGLDVLPSIVTDLDTDGAAAVQIAENIQREDLSTLDAANAVRTLYSLCGNSVTDTAAKLHKSKGWVSKHLAASCPSLHWSARNLLENGVTEDLEIVLAIDKMQALDWTATMQSIEDLKAGNAGRKTILDTLSALKKEREEADKAKAAAKAEQAAQPKPSKAEQKKEAEKRAAEQAEARAELERSPKRILWRVINSDYKTDDLSAEHAAILETHLMSIYEKGNAITSSKEYRAEMARMIDSQDYTVIEIDTFSAGYLGESHDVDKILAALAEALL